MPHRMSAKVATKAADNTHQGDPEALMEAKAQPRLVDTRFTKLADWGAETVVSGQRRCRPPPPCAPRSLSPAVEPDAPLKMAGLSDGAQPSPLFASNAGIRCRGRRSGAIAPSDSSAPSSGWGKICLLSIRVRSAAPSPQLWSSGRAGRGKNSIPSSERDLASSAVASPWMPRAGTSS